MGCTERTLAPESEAPSPCTAMGCTESMLAPKSKIKLVDEIGTEQEGKNFVFYKKTRAVVKHGFYGGGAKVRCPSNHGMTAGISAEIIQGIASACSTRECEECEASLEAVDGFYYCKECSNYKCPTCARKQIGLPVVDDCEGNPIELEAGDILMAWPEVSDNIFIHHVIMFTGGLEHEPEVGVDLNCPPGVEMWSANTIESTALEKGVEFWWYPSKSFFARDRYEKTAKLCASLGEDGCPGVCEIPQPVKVLLHPLRPEFGGPGVDDALLASSIQEAAQKSKKYGYGTFASAAKGNIKDLLHLTNYLKESNYPTEAHRAQLYDEIVASWERSPICSSVPIKVWQKYFVQLGPTPEEAVQNILKYMPVLCHQTSPSQLTEILSHHGWVLDDSFEP